MKFKSLSLALFTAVAAWTMSTGALAQSPEDTIRKNLKANFANFPAIDEVRPAPVAGLYEVRHSGNEIMYTDAKAEFLVQGNIIDVKTRRNLTEERVDKLLAIDFEKLPFRDSFVIVRGKGQRKLAVFEDPNCGYCKRFERDLQKIDNVTVYMFLYPILGPDSTAKSRSLWCAKDKAKAWQDWMVRDVVVKNDASCNTDVLARNVEFGRKNKINGTPTLFFADGSRVPGAIGADQIEKLLSEAK
jgi:thiol:disulfide interchange protein DsbC